VFATILFINIDLDVFCNGRLLPLFLDLPVSEAKLSRSDRPSGNVGLVRGLPV
jgi:hypothetical protein